MSFFYSNKTRVGISSALGRISGRVGYSSIGEKVKSVNIIFDYLIVYFYHNIKDGH